MQPKIKILHIIKSLGRGGAEMLLPETLKLHHQDRFEFHYIYFLPWKNQLVTAIEQAGGKVTCFSASNNFLIILRFWKIGQFIKSNEIDVVHCHLPWAGFVGRLIYVFSKIPVLYTEHNKQERYHFLTRWINRLSFNWQTAAIAVSNDVANSIHKNIRVKIAVNEIRNGVNTAEFQRDSAIGERIRKDLQIPVDAIVVGTIAVFRFQKRLPEWLQIFARVSATHPNLFALIVGDGPLKGEVQQAIDKLNLNSKVILAGLQVDVKPWLSAMDVFMMASVFEGLPVALLEAMSMQCAIITTDAGGIKEVIQPNVSGLMVNVDQWELLSDQLKRVVEDSKVAAVLGKAARKRVVESFGMEVMVKELEQVYVNYRLPIDESN